MIKQLYLRKIKRDNEKKLREFQRLDKKAQKQFYKELEKRIKQSFNGSFFPNSCPNVSPNDSEMERLKAKYSFLDFRFEITNGNVMIVTWILK